MPRIHAWVTALVAAISAGLVLAATGSGQVARQGRTLPAFEAIDVSGAIDLEVRAAAQQAVTVEADDNLLPLLETLVETREGVPTLVVRWQRGERIRTRVPTRVSVGAVRLGSIEAAGSGDVQVHGLKTPALRLSLAGSGDAKLHRLDTDDLRVAIAGSGDIVGDGRATRLKVSIAGSGDAALAALVADEARISIAGSGAADVTANRALTVSIAGSGDVRYGGVAPQVKTSVAGSGSVAPR